MVLAVLALSFILPLALGPFLPKTIGGLPRSLVLPLGIVALLMTLVFYYFRAKHRKRG